MRGGRGAHVMNKEQSLALYRQGREAWNVWAAQQINAIDEFGAPRNWDETATADFAGCDFKEDANFSGFKFPGLAKFNQANFSGSAVFEDVSFCRDAMFYSVKFDGAAKFANSTFDAAARFEGATFVGVARFVGATFTGAARFNGATFKTSARFSNTTFVGAVRFEGTNFFGDAWFTPAIFESFSDFRNVRFRHVADFSAINGKSTFLLTDIFFFELPNFVQAHFEEAPRLDNLRIEPRKLGLWGKIGIFLKGILVFRWLAVWKLFLRAFSRYRGSGRSWFSGNVEEAPRWRALKRLAIQGHDHEREQIFFKCELLARRWVTDRPNHAAFWFGLFYQILSDFGRSLLRPIFWLVAGWVASAGFYLSQQIPAGKSASAGFSAVLHWIVPTTQANATQMCEIVGGDAVVSAFGLSLQKTLFSGFGSTDKLNQFYACLYGLRPEGRFLPNIPDAVAFFGVGQALFSAVLIFLFLLAVRNHFRIK